MPRSDSFCKKDNYWSKLRVEKNIKISEVADYLGCSIGCVGAYFSGQTLPPEEVIAKLCDLFDVDQLKGTQEFISAHKEWDTEGHVAKVLKQAEAFNESVKERQKAIQSNINPPAPIKKEVTTDIFGLVYGKISYEEFNKFFELVAGKSGEPLELIYGKVDYATFKQISNIIKEG